MKAPTSQALILLFLTVALLSSQALAEPEQAHLVLLYEKSVTGLEWKSKVLKVVQANERRFAIVSGRYDREGWKLIFENRAIRLSRNKTFSLKIPLLKKMTQLELAAIGPGTAKEMITIAISAPGSSLGTNVRQISSEEAAEALGGSALELKSIEIGGRVLLQKSGRNLFTPSLAWAPEWRFSRSLALRAYVGVILGKKIDSALFAIFDAELLLAFRMFRPLYLEVGGGIQTWVGNGGTKALGSVNLIYELGKLLDKSSPLASSAIALGYSAIPANNFTHEAKLAFIFTAP